MGSLSLKEKKRCLKTKNSCSATVSARSVETQTRTAKKKKCAVSAQRTEKRFLSLFFSLHY